LNTTFVTQLRCHKKKLKIVSRKKLFLLTSFFFINNSALRLKN